MVETILTESPVHLRFVPLTLHGLLSAKKIIDNRQKLCRWQDLYHNFMPKEFPEPERDRASKKTGSGTSIPKTN